MDNQEMRRNILALVNNDGIFNQIAQEAFNSVDIDHSHEIDKEEFKECAIQVAKGFGLEEPDQEAINEIYQKLDSDNNGNIDFDEFKNVINNKTWSDETVADFCQFDDNNSNSDNNKSTDNTDSNVKRRKNSKKKGLLALAIILSVVNAALLAYLIYRLILIKRNQ